MYYDWNSILQQKSDSELFQALYETHLPAERRIAAEKILIERKIIKKNNLGYYEKEIIEKRFLKLTRQYFKPNLNNETLDVLIQNGLDKESSQRLIEHYAIWKKNSFKRQIIWSFALLLGITIEIINEVFLHWSFLSFLCNLLIIISSIIICKPLFTSSGFEKNKIFKVLNPAQE